MKTSHIVVIVLVIGISTALICIYIKSQQESAENDQRKSRKIVREGFSALEKVITEAIDKKATGEKSNLVTELNCLKSALKDSQVASSVTVKVPTV